MSEEKREEEIAPSMNPEERPDLQDYKSKDKVTPPGPGKKPILLRILLFLHQKEMCKQKQN
jgi:hypothetical protein